MQLFDRITTALLTPFFYPALSNQRIFVLYLLGALALAGGVYLWDRSAATKTLGGFLRYCFPASIYKHASTRIDLVFFVINRVAFLLLFAPLILSSGIAVHYFSQLLEALFGGAGGLAGSGWALVIALTFLTMLAVDFGIFITHYLQHKIPFLWQFHKVHHSAQVLSPITVYRMHPVDDLFTITITGVLSGLVIAAFQFGFAHPVDLVTLFSLNLFTFLFYMFGYNLRHSHIWLSYGPLHSALISPAQHQIHHSCAPRHFDKNFGFIFSFWDRLFGCLYVPREKESFPLGLSNDEHLRYSSVARLYWLPLKDGWNVLRSSVPTQAGCAALTLVGVGLLWQSLVAGPIGAPLTNPSLSEKPPSLHLEALTWTEVRALVDAGYTTVIVPTGGVEQNGPHMVLGKHDYIVHHTGEAIAGKLENALVAPVLPYVPEGRIEPPEGHMRFAGTLSLPESTYIEVLKATAKSLRAHGFRLICFVGDSAGNQSGQIQAAAQLNNEWSDGARALAVTDYYANNGQFAWLQRLGYSADDIGGHAGIRDTSELLVVAPDKLRPNKFARNGGSTQSGVNGNPKMATKRLGEKLLTLKINAAVRQIRAAANPSGAPN